MYHMAFIVMRQIQVHEIKNTTSKEALASWVQMQEERNLPSVEPRVTAGHIV